MGDPFSAGAGSKCFRPEEGLRNRLPGLWRHPLPEDAVEEHQRDALSLDTYVFVLVLGLMAKADDDAVYSETFHQVKVLPLGQRIFVRLCDDYLKPLPDIRSLECRL